MSETKRSSARLRCLLDSCPVHTVCTDGGDERKCPECGLPLVRMSADGSLRTIDEIAFYQAKVAQPGFVPAGGRRRQR